LRDATRMPSDGNTAALTPVQELDPLSAGIATDMPDRAPALVHLGIPTARVGARERLCRALGSPLAVAGKVANPRLGLIWSGSHGSVYRAGPFRPMAPTAYVGVYRRAVGGPGNRLRAGLNARRLPNVSASVRVETWRAHPPRQAPLACPRSCGRHRRCRSCWKPFFARHRASDHQCGRTCRRSIRLPFAPPEVSHQAGVVVGVQGLRILVWAEAASAPLHGDAHRQSPTPCAPRCSNPRPTSIAPIEAARLF